MCGIFGFQYAPDTRVTPTQRAIVATILALETESRGKHACGYALYQDGLTYYDKENGLISESALLTDVCEATNLIGHTRFATMGAHTKENAHPYQFGNVIGAHNGCIYNHHALSEKYRRTHEVDSMHLIQHIDEGLDTEELHGYGTVEWMDVRDPGAVYLAAMCPRADLVVEVLPDGQGVIWASTRWPIWKAQKAVKLYNGSVSKTIAIGTVYRIADGKIEETDRKCRLGTFELAPSSKKSKKKVHYYPGVGWADSDDYSGWPLSAAEIEYTDAQIAAMDKADTTPNLPALPHVATTLDTVVDAGVTPQQGWLRGWLRGVPPSTHVERAPLDKPVVRVIQSRKKGRKNYNGNLKPKELDRLNILTHTTEQHHAECNCRSCNELFQLATRY